MAADTKAILVRGPLSVQEAGSGWRRLLVGRLARLARDSGGGRRRRSRANPRGRAIADDGHGGQTMPADFSTPLTRKLVGLAISVVGHGAAAQLAEGLGERGRAETRSRLSRRLW